MGYKICKDNIHENGLLLGNTYRNYQGGKHKYRLLDADGNIYLYLYSDADPKEANEEEIFAPLDKFQPAYGVTDIEYKDKETGKYLLI